jgi:hypothetical protein
MVFEIGLWNSYRAPRDTANALLLLWNLLQQYQGEEPLSQLPLPYPVLKTQCTLALARLLSTNQEVDSELLTTLWKSALPREVVQVIESTPSYPTDLLPRMQAWIELNDFAPIELVELAMELSVELETINTLVLAYLVSSKQYVIPLVVSFRNVSICSFRWGYIMLIRIHISSCSNESSPNSFALLLIKYCWSQGYQEFAMLWGNFSLQPLQNPTPTALEVMELTLLALRSAVILGNDTACNGNALLYPRTFILQLSFLNLYVLEQENESKTRQL